MKRVIPQALKPGDTIGIISPSSHSDQHDRIITACKKLEQLGFKVRPSRHLNSIDPAPEPADRDKLEDLHAFFADPEINAIFCLRGGSGATRLLPQIDYGLIARNPKIFVGYSDITALSLAMYAKTGLVSYSGPMVGTELHKPTEYTARHLWKILSNPLLPVQEWPNHPHYALRCLSAGSVSGTMIGGNLSLIASLVGTPYLPLPDRILLFLEEVGEPAYRIDRLFSQLANSGLLSRCAALLVGQLHSEDKAPSQKESERIMQIIQYYRQRYLPDAPVLEGLSFGHISNMMTLPIGMEWRITVTEQGLSAGIA